LPITPQCFIEASRTTERPFILSNPVQKPPIDNDLGHVIMTIEEVAQYFRKSPSWVYKNWKILGGKKLGGSLMFPAKEDLYERIFDKRERVEVRLHTEGNQVHEHLVRNKERGFEGRGRKKGGNHKSETENDSANRHGLLGSGK